MGQDENSESDAASDGLYYARFYSKGKEQWIPLKTGLGPFHDGWATLTAARWP